jgi:hypothetical protein
MGPNNRWVIVDNIQISIRTVVSSIRSTIQNSKNRDDDRMSEEEEVELRVIDIVRTIHQQQLQDTAPSSEDDVQSCLFFVRKCEGPRSRVGYSNHVSSAEETTAFWRGYWW